jgi:Carboxypeptidase regulatory-like domain
MPRWSVGINLVSFIVFVIFASASSLRADVAGTIQGIVKDRSEASVANAKVVVINVETNLTHDAVSAADGSFRFLALPVGTYKLTVTATGFRPFIVTDIAVKVNDQQRLDVTLDVGSMLQEVNVVANAVQVQTENTQLGDVVDSKKMLSLPLNGRNYLDLLGLQAGVVPVTSGWIPQDRPVSGGSGGSNVGNVSVNGQRETANAFLVNGGDVSEGRNLGAGLVANLDSVEEFQLITNSFDAEYGKFSGAIMNIITKSGTNSFHGDVFYFLRNDVLDARGFFDPTKPELRQNQFGFAAGGPFWKNRLFWFTDYQGTRIVRGKSSGLVPLMTQDQRNGIFSPTDFVDGSGNPKTVQGAYWAQVLTSRLNPTTGQTVTSGEPYSTPTCTSTGQCVFPGAIIPSVAFSKPSVGILPYIPMGDPVTGLYSNSSFKNTINDDKIGERVDFNNQMTGNWSFYYHWDNSAVFDPFSGSSVPGFSSLTPTLAQQFVLSNTKSFGAANVNELRFSFFRTATHIDEPKSSFANLSDLGFVTGAGTLGIVPSGPPGFPQTVPPIYFTNFSIGVSPLTTFQPNNTFQWADNFSMIKGRHTLKFGGEFRYLQINERNTILPNGAFSFNAGSGGETGNDLADFLLGAPVGYTQSSQQFLDSRTRYGAVFAQDAFKLTPNLVLNLGIRWEVSMPWYDTQGKIETIVPGLQSTQFPTAPLGWVVPGDPGIPSTLAPTRYDNFAPRLGLAYSPGFTDGALRDIFGGPGRSSIRASYGIYYTSIEDLSLFYETGDAPYSLYWVSPNPVLFEEPFRTRADGSSQTQRFPFTFLIPGDPANKTLDYSIYLPISFAPGYSIHNRMPYAEHYNLSFQRELTRATVLTASYVGTQGHKLISQYDANPGNQALCLKLSDPANVFPGSPTCGPYGEQATFTLPTGQWDSVNGCTSGCIQGTRDKLGPNFGYSNSYTANIANSNYNAGEISVEHTTNNLNILAAYTFSKGIDNSSAFGQWVNFANYRLSRSLSAYDMRHNFVISYVWLIPFDRVFQKAPERLTQGWQFNGITRFSTGLPVTISETDDRSLAGSTATDVPDLVGPVKTQNPRKPGPDGPNTYFFPEAFASGPLGAFGNANRQFFHGPGINNTDLGISKMTVIKESLAFELRLEFFNIANHAQFNNPDGDFNSSTFGAVTTTRYGGREGQLSAKFYW